MVATELDEDEDEDAGDGADDRYVQEILYVSIPCRFENFIVGGRRWKGLSVIIIHRGGER